MRPRDGRDRRGRGQRGGRGFRGRDGPPPGFFPGGPGFFPPAPFGMPGGRGPGVPAAGSAPKKVDVTIRDLFFAERWAFSVKVGAPVYLAPTAKTPAGNYLPHPHGHRANAPYVKALGEQLAARGDRGEAAGAGGATVTGAGMGRRDEQAGAGAGAEDPSVAAAEGEGGGVAGVREAKGEGERAPESGVVVPPAPPLPLVALQRGHLGVFTADHVLMGVLTMQQFRDVPRHFRTGKVRTVKWAATAGADEVADGAVDGAAGQPKAADGVGGADSGAAVEEGREVKRRRVEGDGGAGEAGVGAGDAAGSGGVEGLAGDGDGGTSGTGRGEGGEAGEVGAGVEGNDADGGRSGGAEDAAGPSGGAGVGAGGGVGAVAGASAELQPASLPGRRGCPVESVTVRVVAGEGIAVPPPRPPPGAPPADAPRVQPSRPWEDDRNEEDAYLRLPRVALDRVASDPRVVAALADRGVQTVMGCVDACTVSRAEALVRARLEDHEGFRKAAFVMLDLVEGG